MFHFKEWKKTGIFYKYAHHSPTTISQFPLFLIHFLNFIVVQVQFSALFSPTQPNPYPSPPPSYFNPPHPRYCPCVLYNCSYKPFTLFPLKFPPLSPLVTAGLFSISVSLVVFCWFVLLIRFLLKVRSYGICLSPPGLFHLAYALQFHPCCHKG